MELNKWHQSVRRHITCADGTTFSIQASDFHYCEPRKIFRIDDKDFKGYKSVEIMCKDESDEDILAEYIPNVARRTSEVKHFGRNREVLENLINETNKRGNYTKEILGETK